MFYIERFLPRFIGTDMGHQHSHDTSHLNEQKLRWALLLTGSFLIIELIGALVSGSLALLSDATHMLTDVLGLVIAIVGIRLGRRPADPRRTFGYYRFEILAALANALMLFGIAIYILLEAYQRFREPVVVQSGLMFGVAIAGLIVNFVCMRILSGDHEQSLNMKGAYLEVWSDFISSIAVIIAAIVIYFTQWWWVDIVLALAIGLWMVPRTWRLIQQSVNVLLEGVPLHLNADEIQQTLAAVPGVQSVHDLHVWELSSGKVSLTAHAVVDLTQHAYETVLSTLLAELEQKFSIQHATIQIEPTGGLVARHAHDFGHPHFSENRAAESHHHADHH